MANHLDLEEQEQIDQLKHFWNTWGNLISSVLLLVFGSIAIWNGYQFWQNRQSMQAAALQEELNAAIRAKDDAKLEQAFKDIRDKYASTQQSVQAGLLASKAWQDNKNAAKSEEALLWVVQSGADEGKKAIARLRLAGLLLEKGAYDDALKQLSAPVPPEFEAIVADRQGDIRILQQKPAEALEQYRKAHDKLGAYPEFKRLVAFKLNALGFNPDSTAVASSDKGGPG